LQALAEQHGNLSLFSFWMDELDTDTNEEDAIPSPMRDEGKPPSSPVDSGISNNPALAKINFPRQVAA
jgi:hypothetical protein